MVYSADRIPRAEALASQKRLAALLSYKLKQEYSEIVEEHRSLGGSIISRLYHFAFVGLIYSLLVFS